MPLQSNGQAEQQWRLEVLASDDGVEPFTDFIDGLDEFTFVAVDAALSTVLAVRGLGLSRTEWLKPLGQGLHELRVRHDAAEIDHMFGTANNDAVAKAVSPPRPILIRVFLHFHGDRVALLLSGYDKAVDSSQRRQQREIAQARKFLNAWREQQKRLRKAEGLRKR